MTVTYYPRGTCSRRMIIETEGDIIRSVRVDGGCPGNLQAISRLMQGMKISEAIEKMEGIRCGHKSTSCPDQLAQALKTLPDR